MSDEKKKPGPGRPLSRARAALEGTVEAPAAEGAGEETPPPVPAGKARPVQEAEAPDPTRYGDWERKGRCIDF